MAFLKKTFLLSGVAVVARSMWTPEDAHQLDAVASALHKFEHAKLSPAERKMAMGTVHEVEKTLLYLNDKSLTKAQKGEKVKKVLHDLQVVQSQWQLASVEGSLKKVLQMRHLTSEQLATAKRVVADVDAVVEAYEAGTLTGPARAAKVSFAIKELSDFEHSLVNSTIVERKNVLEAEMKEKQLMLKREESMLRFAKLQKELLDQQGKVKRLAAREQQMESAKKQQQEDEAQQNMVNKLLSMAKALVSKKTKAHNATKIAPLPAKKANTSSTSALEPILKDLRAREHNVTQLLDKMDAAETKREADWAKEQTKGEKDTHSDKVVSALRKKMSRSYRQVRAMKLAEQKELKEAIQSIESGDIAALSKVMAKMKSEYKSMEAKSKGFLY